MYFDLILPGNSMTNALEEEVFLPQRDSVNFSPESRPEIKDKCVDEVRTVLSSFEWVSICVTQLR